MQPNWQIYALKDPRTDEVRYVGISHNLTKRFKDHYSQRLSVPKGLWIEELRNEGLKPSCLILEEGTGSWAAAEKKWIAYYRSLGCDLTNRTSGGQGKPGAKHSQETIRRMSQPRSAAGRANIAAAMKLRWFNADPATKQRAREHMLKVRKLRSGIISAETRTKLSIAHRGIPKSTEHRAKLAEGQRAWLDADPSRREQLRLKPQSPQTAEKISKTLRGRKLPLEQRLNLKTLMAKRKRDPQTGRVLRGNIL